MRSFVFTFEAKTRVNVSLPYVKGVWRLSRYFILNCPTHILKIDTTKVEKNSDFYLVSVSIATFMILNCLYIYRGLVLRCACKSGL